MKVDLGIWSKLNRLLVVLLVLVTLVGVALWYLPLIQQNERWSKQKLRLEHQIKQEEDLARQLKVSIKSLQEDPKAVERLARESLGYAKSNETVIRFSPPATNGINSRSP